MKWKAVWHPLTLEFLALFSFVYSAGILSCRWIGCGSLLGNQAALGAFCGGALTAFVAFSATRRLSASQIGSPLLARFHSPEFYAARRNASREFYYFHAGDRSLIAGYWIARPFPYHLSQPPRPYESHPAIGITLLWGFVVELENYWLNGLLSRRDINFLFLDRLNWFATSFGEWLVQMDSAIKGKTHLLDPPSLRAIGNRPISDIPFRIESIQDWLPLVINFRSTRPAANDPRPRTFPSDRHNFTTNTIGLRQIEFDGYEAHEVSAREATNFTLLIKTETWNDSFIKLFRSSPHNAVLGSSPVEYFLNVRSRHPFTLSETFQRLNVSQASAWYWRLVYQNCMPEAAGLAESEKFVYSTGQ
ncbi:hypothetical protein WDZ92_22155 [Nostoc sp. NIES-2111]